VIDRFLFFFFSLLYSINVSRCLLKKNRKSRAILVFLFLSLSIICPKIAQRDQFSANHWRRPIANFFLSLSLCVFLYKDIGIFSPFLLLTDHKSRTRKGKEERERRRLKRVTTGACHTSFCIMNISFLSVNIERVREREKKFQSSLRLFYIKERLSSFSLLAIIG
jgi:hypothetical protein